MLNDGSGFKKVYLGRSRISPSVQADLKRELPMASYKRGSAGDHHRPVSDTDAGSENRCPTPNRRSYGS